MTRRPVQGAEMVGLIEGVGEATASISKLFSGWISDKLGKRKALIIFIRCGHMLLTTEKIRALVDNIRGNKNRIIEGEVGKKGDDDG